MVRITLKNIKDRETEAGIVEVMMEELIERFEIKDWKVELKHDSEDRD